MNQYQESLLDAIKILTGKTVEESKLTKTIECEIAEVVDAAAGKYKVTYANNKFDALAASACNYKVGDLVFVLLPEGKFTDVLSIIGPAEENEEAIADPEIDDIYIKLSDSLISDYGEIKLCTYKSETKEFDLGDSFKTEFSQQLEDYNNFIFSFKVRTNIAEDQQVKGNYGAILRIPIIKDAGTGTEENDPTAVIDLILDVNTMTGNPYDFQVYAKQKLIYDFSGIEFDSSREPKLIIFCTDFVQRTFAPEEIIPYDIFIRDIMFEVVDVLPQEDLSGYHLTLVASKGNVFTDSDGDSKTITPILKIKGKDKQLDTYACYWFIRDASIKTTSEQYSQYGGQGQKCLNDRVLSSVTEDGKKIYSYIQNKYEYKINKNQVKTSLEIKCVLIKENVIVQNTIKLKKAVPEHTCELVTFTGDTFFEKDFGTISLIARINCKTNFEKNHRIKVAFQRYDDSGKYIDDDFYTQVRENDQKSSYVIESEINFPVSYIVNSNLFVCTFYDNYVNSTGVEINDIIGTSTLVLFTEEVYDYKLVILNADLQYKYDSDGDSPMISDYDGEYRPQVIIPFNYKIYKADGSEFTDEEYQYCKCEQKVPKNSMIKMTNDIIDDYQVVTHVGRKDINYNILDTFNDKQIYNGVVSLKVTFKDKVLEEVKVVGFTKDGAMGTNGSKQSAVILYNGLQYGQKDPTDKVDPKISKLQFVYVDGSAPYWAYYNYRLQTLTKLINAEIPNLKVQAYCNGEIANYDKVTQSMFDNDYVKPVIKIDSVTGAVSPEAGAILTSDFSNCSVVQAEVEVGSQDETGHQEVLYIYYPIELTYIPNPTFIDFPPDKTTIIKNVIPTITGGYSRVLYSSDGRNPKFDNSNDFIFENGISSIDGVSFYDISQEVPNNGNLIVKQHEGNYAKIIPSTNFNNGKSNNQIKGRISIAEGRQEETKEEYNKVCDGKEYEEEKLFPFYNNLNNLISDANNNLTNVIAHQIDPINEFNMKEFSADRDKLVENVKRGINLITIILNYCKAKIPNPTIIIQNQIEDLKIKQTLLNNLKIGLQEFIYQSGSQIPSMPKITLSSDSLPSAQYHKLKDYISQYESARNAYDKAKSDISGDNLIESQNIFSTFKNNIKSYIEDSTSYLNRIIDISDFDYSQAPEGEKDQTPILTPKEEFTCLKEMLISIYQRMNNIFQATNIEELTPEQQQALEEEYAEKGYAPGITIDDLVTIFNDFYSILQLYLIDNKYNGILIALDSSIEEKNKKITEYQELLFDKSSPLYDTIVHVKPIIMSYNTYGLGHLQGQDGNKLYIDNKHGDDAQYLAAPQIGAGKMNNEHKFTGLTMGIRGFNNEDKSKSIGLYGYHEGVQTLCLSAENGSATFGKSGTGQIIVDPTATKGLIYSSKFQKDSNYDKDTGLPISYNKEAENGEGMIIDLSTPEIRFGSGKFSVNSEGELFAYGGGSIAGQTIGFTQLFKNELYLDSGTEHPAVGDKPAYTSYGIYSNTHDQLTKTNNGFYLSNDGLSIGNSIRITASGDDDTPEILVGKVNSNKKQTISANSSDSYIGYNATEFGVTNIKTNSPTITGNASSVYIGTDGIRLGVNFAVDNKGNLLANYLNAKGGKIAGQTIESDQLKSPSNNMTIRSEGSIYGPNNKWHINVDGDAKFDNITCTSVFTIGAEGSDNRQTSNGGFNFNNGSLGTNNVASTGFTFNTGSMSFGTPSGTTGGISCDSSTGNVEISGTIYATAGVIGGCSISGGNLEVPAANITGKLTADQIDANIITAGNLNTEIGRIETLGVQNINISGYFQAHNKMQGSQTLRYVYGFDEDKKPIYREATFLTAQDQLQQE